MLATAEQRPKLRALGFAQLDPITYVHLASPSREVQMNRLCGDVREKLHREAGAILGLHRRLYPRPRPSPGRDRHAAPFPAQPAFRAPHGPHAGAPRPHPPSARRRAQHRGAPRPRRLARPPPPPTSQILCAEELVAASAGDAWAQCAAEPYAAKLLTDTLPAGQAGVPRWLAETVIRAAEVTGADPAYMLALADKESTFDHQAKAKTSSAVGLFQFLEGTWLRALNAYGAKHGFGTA